MRRHQRPDPHHLVTEEPLPQPPLLPAPVEKDRGVRDAVRAEPVEAQYPLRRQTLRIGERLGAVQPEGGRDGLPAQRSSGGRPLRPSIGLTRPGFAASHRLRDLDSSQEQCRLCEATGIETTTAATAPKPGAIRDLTAQGTALHLGLRGPSFRAAIRYSRVELSEEPAQIRTASRPTEGTRPITRSTDGPHRQRVAGTAGRPGGGVWERRREPRPGAFPRPGPISTDRCRRD